MYSLALIIFVVSEKKAFEHFPIGPMLIYVLQWWPSWISDRQIKQTIHGQFGFNCPSRFREEAFWNIFPIGSNVKLCPAVAAILNFISEQKT